jgi:hypothetical protein
MCHPARHRRNRLCPGFHLNRARPRRLLHSQLPDNLYGGKSQANQRTSRPRRPPTTRPRSRSQRPMARRSPRSSRKQERKFSRQGRPAQRTAPRPRTPIKRRAGPTGSGRTRRTRPLLMVRTALRRLRQRKPTRPRTTLPGAPLRQFRFLRMWQLRLRNNPRASRAFRHWTRAKSSWRVLICRELLRLWIRRRPR